MVKGVIHETYVWSVKRSCIKRICDASLCRIFIRFFFFTASAGIFNAVQERRGEIWERMRLCQWKIAHIQLLRVKNQSKCLCMETLAPCSTWLTLAVWIIRSEWSPFFSVFLSFLLFQWFDIIIQRQQQRGVFLSRFCKFLVDVWVDLASQTCWTQSMELRRTIGCRSRNLCWRNVCLFDWTVPWVYINWSPYNHRQTRMIRLFSPGRGSWDNPLSWLSHFLRQKSK